MDTNLVSKVLNWDVLKISKKKLDKKFNCVKSPMSEEENIQFSDSPDFEYLSDMMSSRALNLVHIFVE